MSIGYSDIANVMTSETSGLDERGYSRPMIRTSFAVRGAGPFWVDLPKVGWTAEKADQAVRMYAQEICALLDRYPQG